MTIYEAIMAAAEFIEQHPAQYDYCFFTSVPENESGKGCMMAWTGYFLGYAAGTSSEIVQARLGMTRGVPGHQMGWRPSLPLFTYAAGGAALLRDFASRHFPEPRTFTGLPDSIRQIFEVETA
jgi:hypothetical protein